MDFANDDVAGAFQRQEKPMIEPVIVSEIPMVSGDWETFYKGLFKNEESNF